MIDIANDIQSLSYFKRNSAKVMARLKKTKKPLVLTVNGKAHAIIQDPAEYQQLRENAERAEMLSFLEKSKGDVKAGRTRPIGEFFDELENSL